MELDNNELQEIHDYLSEKMTKNQREEYELKLSNNPELAVEVKVQRELKEGLIFLDLKQKYKNIHQELKKADLLGDKPEIFTPLAETEIKKLPVGETIQTKQKTPAIIISFLNRYAIAACLVIGLSLGWFGVRIYKGKQQNQLAFQEEFSAQPKIRKPVSADDDVLGAPQNTDSSADSAGVINAIKLLEDDKAKEAIAILEKIPKTTSYWNQTAQWYLALAYLKDNERDHAKEILTTFTKTNLYYPEAQKLLGKL